MSKRILGTMFLVAILPSVPAMAGVPNVITHRGVIAVHGQPFNGAGDFRFALVDRVSGDYLWKNDGCIPEVCPDEPLLPVTLTVANGVYHVRLGDGVAHDDDGNPSTPSEVMKPIPRAVFNEHDEVALRIWFNDGDHGIYQLEPDQVLTSAPYSQRLPNVFVDEDTGNVSIGPPEPEYDHALSVLGDADVTGNVGIGTTTPSNALSVDGDADFTGNVGIGTSAPAASLHVQGAAGATIRVGGDGNLDYASLELFENSDAVTNTQKAGIELHYDGEQDELSFMDWTPPSEAPQSIMTLKRATNNVGIGTTSPTEKLDVSGTTRTSELDVRGTTRTSRIEVTQASGFGLVPPGAIMPFAGATPPDGWLLCDGSEKSRTDYAALFAAISTAWGAGNGSTTFHLPDLRGRFLRGVDLGAGQDPDAAGRAQSNTDGNTGDNVGSVQGDATRRPNTSFRTDSKGSHTHQMMGEGRTGSSLGQGDYIHGALNDLEYGDKQTAAAGSHSHSITTGGDAETRPVNAYINWIIKY